MRKDLTWEIRRYLELKQQNLADGIKRYLYERSKDGISNILLQKEKKKRKTNELHVRLKKPEREQEGDVRKDMITTNAKPLFLSVCCLSIAKD